MTFENKNEASEALSYDAAVKKFWGKMASMITGSDSDFAYLKRILHKMNEIIEKMGIRNKKKRFKNALKKALL